MAAIVKLIKKCFSIRQSVEVYDYVKKDIGEFTQTVQEEVTSTASALKQKLNVRCYGK